MKREEERGGFMGRSRGGPGEPPGFPPPAVGSAELGALRLLQERPAAGARTRAGHGAGGEQSSAGFSCGRYSSRRLRRDPGFTVSTSPLVVGEVWLLPEPRFSPALLPRISFLAVLVFF